MSPDDDLEPVFQGRRKGFDAIDIESLSIEELQAYIAHARQEITRAEAEIESRESLRGDADALFRK